MACLNSEAVPNYFQRTMKMRRFRHCVLTPVLLALLLVAGCRGDRPAGQEEGERLVELDLDDRATDEIVGYYVGAFLPAGAPDAFESRLAIPHEGRYFVDLDRLDTLDSLSARLLAEAAGEDLRVDWDEFAAFIAETYGRVRDIPPTRAALDEREGFSRSSPEWMHLDALGVMSTQRRRVFVPREDVISALRTFRANENRIIYPAGTVFIGEHLDEASVTETTVMRKSEDGYWEFFAYDGRGNMADSTLAMPRSRQVPTQCVGCHFGDKLYEPERSFPAEAEDGPHGPRRIFADEALRDPEVVSYFDEHRRRSDRVLGLYATILASRLRAERAEGALDADHEEILRSLGL